MKNVILAKIADFYGHSQAIPITNNSTYEAIIKCANLSSYWLKYADFLTPYTYAERSGKTWQNHNLKYDPFSGINGLLEELSSTEQYESIVCLLSELAKRISPLWANDNPREFNDLVRLYEMAGLSLTLENECIEVKAFTQSGFDAIKSKGILESWMYQRHPRVLECYESAIDAYKDGRAGMCIESCRTAIVTLFEAYKGPEACAKWIRGVYNLSGENRDADLTELNKALHEELNKNDIADFFIENRSGSLKKTKAIYSIYSMLSDYGTHRGEASPEYPSLNDALMALQFTEAIILWIVKTHN